MINKSVQYGLAEDPVMLLEFGEGDIHLFRGVMPNGVPHLMFRNIEPGKIDRTIDIAGKTVTDLKPELVFIFNKVESIEVLMNMLKIMKEEMLNHNKSNDGSDTELGG